MPDAPPRPFDAVLLWREAAGARVGGLALLERAAFTLARAGARRLLCVGEPPARPWRLPPVPVAWTPGEPAALAAWSEAAEAAPVVLGADAATVADTTAIAALAAAPEGPLLQAEGEAVVWRCERRALAAVLAAARAGTGAPPRLPPGARPWRPPPGALLVRADDAASRAAAEAALYARLGRPGDGWFTRTFDRRLSRAITRALLPTGVPPNGVTLVSIGIGVTAGLLFATGHGGAALAGALLFLLSTILDGCDGEIARLTFRESRLGARLDIAGDNLVHLVLFGGIAAGLYRRAPDERIVLLGVLLVAGALLSMATVYRYLVAREPTPAQRSLFEAFASREFAYLLVLLTAAGKLEWFLWAAAAGTYLFVAGLIVLGLGGGRRALR